MTTPVCKDISRRAAVVALLALFFGHALANAWWLAHDQHSYHADEAMHLGHARDHYATLFLRDDAPVSERLGEAFARTQYYPPLLHLLGAVGIRLAPACHPDRVAHVMTPIFLLLLAGTYLFARELFDRRQSLLATVIASLCPLLFGASRLFMTDFLSAAFVVWAMLALLRARGFRHLPWTLAFGLIAGVGMLARQTTAGFLLVPALATLGAGLVPALGARPRDWATVRLVGRNVAVVFVLSLLPLVPWYIYHSDVLYGFWVTRFGSRFFAATDPLRLFGPLLVLAAVLAVAGWGLARCRAALAALLDRHAALRRPGGRALLLVAATLTVAVVLLHAGLAGLYARYLLEEGGFPHVLFAALAGMLLWLWRGRLRTAEVLVLLWLVGGYALFTLLFSTRVPRYLVPAVPAIALLATAALGAIPRASLRRAFTAGLLVLLALQFVHLTRGIPGIHAVRLPRFLTGNTGVYDEPGGWPVLKDRLILGNYAVHAAQREPGFTDRLLRAMVRDMRERRPVPETWANYQLLTNMHQFEGTEFAQEHYWPDHRFALAEETPSPTPMRLLGNRWQRDPEELAPFLDATDFVLMKAGFNPDRENGPRGRARAEQFEAAWQQYLEARGFEVVDRFFEPRYSLEFGGSYTLMARSLQDGPMRWRWNLAKPTGRGPAWEPRLPGETAPGGMHLRVRESGPMLHAQGLGLDTADFSVARVELKAACGEDPGRTGVGPERVYFFWANPRHAFAGETPFNNTRAVELYPARPGVWEARVAKHRNWTGVLDQAMLAMDFAFPAEPVERRVRRWRFPDYAGGKDAWRLRWPSHTLPTNAIAVEMGENGPLAELDLPLDTARADYVDVRMALRPRHDRAGRELPVEKAHVYWAGRENVAGGGWPFAADRGVRFLPVEGDPGRYRALLRDRASWAGLVTKWMIGVDLPADGAYDVVLREVVIGQFASPDPQACMTYDLTVKAITFLH